ncbi:hypothetical protein VTO42DRAFT_4914 [Malbranchea cinnamomea]
MSLCCLPLSLLSTILDLLIHPRWMHCGPETRNQVMNLRLVNRMFNAITVNLAFHQLQLCYDYDSVEKMSREGLTLLIREKLAANVDSPLKSLISRLRRIARRWLVLLTEDHETNAANVVEDYVTAFIDAVMSYMGIPDTYLHLYDQNLPEEAMLFGARLGDADLLMVAAVWLGDRDLVLSLAWTGQLGTRAGSKVHIVSQYLACLRADVEMLHVIKHIGNPNPNAPSGYWGTALKAAVWIGDATAVSTMIKFGADVNAIGATYYVRPLSLAILRGNMEVIHLLLQAGAAVAAGNDDNQSALCTAVCAKTHSVPILKLLVEYGTTERDYICQSQNALFVAVHNGNLEAVKLLLGIGVSPTALVGPDQRPILDAVSNSKSVEIMELLLAAGAQFTESVTGGELFWSQFGDDTDMDEIGAKYKVYQQENLDKAIKRILLMVLGSSQQEFTTFLIGKLSDEAILSPDFRRLFTEAVKRGDAPAVLALLGRGVPAQAPDEDIWSEMQGCHQGWNSVVDLLLSRGVKPNLQLLRIAVDLKRRDLVKNILEEHSDWTMSCLDKKARQICPRCSEPDRTIIRMLLDAGVRFTPSFAGCMFVGAAMVRDCRTMELLLRRCPYMMIEPVYDPEPWMPVLHINDITMIHDTRMAIPESESDALALLQSIGSPDAVEIARVLKEMQISTLGMSPVVKVCHALDQANIPLLKFFLKYHPEVVFTEIYPQHLKRETRDEIREVLRRHVCDVLGADHPAVTFGIDDPWLSVDELFLCPRDYELWHFPASPHWRDMRHQAVTETEMRSRMVRRFRTVLHELGEKLLLDHFIRRDNALMVQILLELGIHCDDADSDLGIMLPLADAFRHDTISMLLMDAGVDPGLSFSSSICPSPQADFE